MSGKLVVIEGMDGAGTTTQTKELSLKLQQLGYSVLTSAEPTKSELGLEIRRMLALPIAKDRQMLISLALCFAADRMQHLHSIVGPALKTYDFVLLDRYVLSSLVYQGLDLPIEFIREINQFAMKPHVTFILDVEVELALERLSKRSSTRDFYEAPELLKKIKERYVRLGHEEKMALVDGNGSVEEVQSHILHVLLGAK